MSRPLEIQMPAAAKPYAPAVKEPALQAVDAPGSAPRVAVRAKPEVAEKLPARELFLISAKKHSLAALMTFVSIGALVAFSGRLAASLGMARLHDMLLYKGDIDAWRAQGHAAPGRGGTQRAPACPAERSERVLVCDHRGRRPAPNCRKAPSGPRRL